MTVKEAVAELIWAVKAEYGDQVEIPVVADWNFSVGAFLGEAHLKIDIKGMKLKEPKVAFSRGD